MYDVIIIGGGPSGITAGIYAKRSGLKSLIIEKSNVGGQVINTYEIKNFPTYENISGADFCMKLYDQAQANELEIINDEVLSVSLTEDVKVVKTVNEEFKAKCVIICTGTKSRNLGLIDEEKYIGKGISYCALCDGNFFKDKIVCVVGGGDSAMEDAIYLGGICKKVYVLNRSDKLRAQNILQESLNKNIEKNHNIEVLFNCKVEKLYGDEFLNSVDVCQNGKITNLKVDGLFLAIGKDPDTKLFENQIKLDQNKYILVDNNLQTNLKGVYAGGDCTQKLIRQIITACNDGAVCATNVNNYLKKN